jgi:hypothetical protein
MEWAEGEEALLVNSREQKRFLFVGEAGENFFFIVSTIALILT